jgi:putative ABC transport system permease protein
VEGYRFFLMDVSPQRAPQVAGALEDALSDYGFDVQSTEARLASFHRVENTYLSTFRSLGALGLLLGTIGLAAILLRNVLERRRELALLRAVGYRPLHLAVIVLAENLLLLVLGLATGTICALLAIAPALSMRGGRLPIESLAVLLGAVLITGIAASLAATRAALRSPVLAALRSE